MTSRSRNCVIHNASLFYKYITWGFVSKDKEFINNKIINLKSNELMV